MSWIQALDKLVREAEKRKSNGKEGFFAMTVEEARRLVSIAQNVDEITEKVRAFNRGEGSMEDAKVSWYKLLSLLGKCE